MKDDVGIDPNYCPDEGDEELEQVLIEMKRNATATNFRPFLRRSQNFDRNTAWKQISRKVYDDDKKQKVKIAAYHTSQLINNSNQNQEVFG